MTDKSKVVVEEHEHEDDEDSLIDLANHMTLCDVMRLIAINMDRIKIFHYENGTFDDISSVGFNGAVIQITTNVDDE